MLVFLWILVIIGALFGGCTLIDGFLSAKSAPQQAAAGALAAALAIIPYCIARAASEISGHAGPPPQPEPAVLYNPVSARPEDCGHCHSTLLRDAGAGRVRCGVCGTGYKFPTTPEATH